MCTDEDGEEYYEIYDEESYYVIADENVNYNFYFIISPEDIKNKEAIYLDITDLDELTSDDEYYTVSIPVIMSSSESNETENPDDNNNYRQGSSGGCAVGFSVLSLGLALMAIVLKRKKF